MNEPGKNATATVATVCGIVSLVVAIIGGILFGVIGAVIALACGIVALVFGIKAKKETNGQKGSAGFVCGLLGVIFAAIFAIGCSMCGGYGCYGCVGVRCMVNDFENDFARGANEFQNALKNLP